MDIGGVDRLHEELVDRYGEMPPEAVNLLTFFKMKILLNLKGYHSLSVKSGKIILEGSKGIYRPGGRIPLLEEKSPSGQFEELYLFLKKRS